MNPSPRCLLVPSTSSQPVEPYRPSTETAFGRLLLSKFHQQGGALESAAAHQLHSIPPRTKTTSGLVVDHLLWLHAQARVASARAVIENDGPRKRAQAARAGGLHKVIHALTATSTDKGDKFRLAFGALVEQLFEPPTTATLKPKRLRTKANKRAIVPDEICALSAATYGSSTSPSSQKSFALGPSWAQPLGIVGASHHNTPPSSPFDAGCPHQDRCIRHFAAACTLCGHFAPSSSTIGAGLDTLNTSAPLYALRRRSENVEGKSDGAEQASSPTLEALVYFLRLSAYILLSMDDESADLNAETLSTLSASASTDSLTSTLESGTPHGSSTDVSVNADMDVDERSEKRYPLRPVDVHQRLRQSFGFQFSFSRYKEEFTPKMESRKSKPTHEWYTLLADLVTRCVLEGYLLCGWKGVEHARVIFGLGSRVPPSTSPNAEKDTKRRSIFSRRSTKTDSALKAEDPEHEEDGLPSLTEAAELFFGAGADANVLAAYRETMSRRLEEFTTLPSRTSLVKHLESLAHNYGFMENAEKCVDKEVVDFCEAVVQWKGLPELEQYKQAHTTSAPAAPTTPNTAATRSSPRMSIAALIHHDSPLPSMPSNQPEPIARFFLVPNDRKGAGQRRRPVQEQQGQASHPITPSLSPASAVHDIPVVIRSLDGHGAAGGIRLERDEISAVYGNTTTFGGSKGIDNTFVLGSKRPREDEDEGEGAPLKKLLVVGTSGFSS